MPDFETLFNGLKEDIAKLGKDTLGEFAAQATADATGYLDAVKANLKKYAEQFAAGQMSKDEFVDLLNSEQLLGQMKIETQIGLAKIKADTFMAGVKSIVLDTLLKLAVKIL